MDLGFDARREGQYAATARLIEQAVAIAESLGELPLLVYTRAWLASAYTDEGHRESAMPLYFWLIGIATAPALQGQVSDYRSQWTLATSFIGLLSCGSLMEMPVADLLRVVADGTAWVEAIGKPEWAAAFRLQRGRLLRKQGDLEAARREMETALALRRRHKDPPGPSLENHLLNLGLLLNDPAVGEYAEAIPLAEEILDTQEGGVHSRHSAYLLLARAYLGLGDLDRALGQAQMVVAIAQTMESPSAKTSAYGALSRVYQAAGQLTDAAESTAQMYVWAIAHSCADCTHSALTEAAKTRLLQARQAASLPLKGDDFPATLPPDADRALASRWLAGAHRFIRRARVPAARLDAAAGTRKEQDALDKLALEGDELGALLGSGGAG